MKSSRGDILGTKVRKKKLSDSRLFYIYISPWLIGLTCFTLFPMVLSLIFSFTNVKMSSATTAPLEFVGLKNYIDIFKNDQDFLRSIFNTFIYAFAKVFLTVVIGLLIALLLNASIPGRKFFRTMIYMPAVIPVVSVALLWKLIFTGNELNIANYVLSLFGLGPYHFFGNEIIAMLTVIFVGVWSGLGPVMLILLAALQGISQDLLEAAELDGANSFKKFIHIILPSISPSILFVTITGLIGSLQAYAEIKLLTGGGPGNATTTMNLVIVNNAFNNLGRKTLGYASAQGWIVFTIILIFTIVFLRLANKRVYYESGGA